MKKVAKKATKKVADSPMIGKFCVVGNRSYGLYAGVVSEIEDAPDGTSIVLVAGCRHVAYWHGRTGGITSLAEHGLCGPRAAESRIGAPAALARLSGVVTMFACSDAATATIVSAVQK